MTVIDTRVAEDSRRMGALAAFGMAAMPVFIAAPRLVAASLGVGPPTSADLDTEVAAIVAHPHLYGSTGLGFLTLGTSLIVLALALHEHLRAAAPFAMRVGKAAGVIGGALFLLGGFGPLALAGQLGGIAAQDHAAAVALYVTNINTTDRLAHAGVILLSVFGLIASTTGARAGLLPGGLSYLGGLPTVAYIVASLLPGGLWFAPIPFILIWSAWLGIVLLRGGRRVVPAPTAPATGALPRTA